MRFFILPVLLLIIKAPFSLLQAQETHDKGLSPSQKDSIRSLMKPFPEGVQVAVGLVDRGGARFFGLERNGNGFEHVENADSIFRIGSLTKVFTATMLADAVDQGRLSLDDTMWDELDIEPALDTAIWPLTLQVSPKCRETFYPAQNSVSRTLLRITRKKSW